MAQLKIKIGGWKITDKEVNLLIKHSDIGRYIKAQRIGWIGAYCKNG
jgi:hypothetical protein